MIRLAVLRLLLSGVNVAKFGVSGAGRIPIIMGVVDIPAQIISPAVCAVGR